MTNPNLHSAAGQQDTHAPENPDNHQRLSAAIAEAVSAAMSQHAAQLTQAIAAGFQSLSLHTTPQRSTVEMQTLPAVEQQMQQLFNRSPPSVPNSRTSSNHSPRSSDIRPDRTSQIMTNWKLRFTGKSSSMSVEDFIYRVEALTNQTLDGNFDLTARYAGNLFESNASEWYWRYHQSVPHLDWRNLCMALRGQFKDDRSDHDIRSEIEQRKQRPNETFDDYYHVIAAIADRLSQPLSEISLLETLRANLLPEIQQDILYEKTNSISELRYLVRKRELFLQSVSKSQPGSSRHGTRRQMMEFTTVAYSRWSCSPTTA
ncbi:hypothetical protein ACLKA7_016678 [Drosophila subpalustris]